LHKVRERTPSRPSARCATARTAWQPPLKSPALVKATTADLIAATTNGKGKMPAYTGKLTDAQIKDVVAYIRTLQK
jgi:mono/diheme cytochrome c family protein